MLTALLGLAASTASGHSLLIASSPAAGATVEAMPREMVLRFNNRIEKPLSRVRLVGASGPARALAVIPGRGTPDTLVAAMPPLEPGTYRVEWQVLSTDGHIVNGSFSFRVGPASRAQR